MVVNRNALWSLAIASTMSVAQTDSAAVDSAAFAVVVPPSDSSSTWDISGSIDYRGSYHYVRTRTNHGETIISGSDTITKGSRFRNYYQVPGFNAEGSAYVRAESPDGKILEFDANVTSDEWNNFSPNPVSLKYSDKYNRAILGDMYKSEGEIYMGSMPLFGIDYTLSLLSNEANEPLLQFNGFFGEAQRPLLPGEKHPYLYNERIDDGEAAAQRIAYGGLVKIAPVQKFDIALGGIYANDEIEDPLLRDGASASTLTSEPLQESFALFADANYKFARNNGNLNLQVAMGRSDTADVVRERAINQVFAEAGIYSTDYSTLRTFMQNESKISTASKAQLDEIFGENCMLTKSEMQDSLRALVKTAKEVQKKTESDRDDDRTLAMNWGDQNLAFLLDGEWNYKATVLRAFVKYVGEDFYSAGSPDQISDSRELGINLDQGILDVWDLALKYDLLIENAAIGNKTNLFGLGEGTRHGLFADTDTKWNKDHERDIDRTRYTQNASIANTFHISNDIRISAGYGIEHRKQYRPFQLHSDFSSETKVYADKWFAPRVGKETTKYDIGDSTIEIDKERWDAYKALASKEYLAAKFQERIFKHKWNAGFSVHRGSTTLNAQGQFTWRIDASKFIDDELVKDMDLDRATWGKLGYYYGEADYFEHRYPIVATTILPTLQNRFSVTPRFKTYTYSDIEESEFTIADEIELSFYDNFFILGLDGEFRYMISNWDTDGAQTSEKESDIIGNMRFKFNHTKRLFSEWVLGAGIYYRPDNLSNEYKDVYGGVNLGYAF